MVTAETVKLCQSILRCPQPTLPVKGRCSHQLAKMQAAIFSFFRRQFVLEAKALSSELESFLPNFVLPHRFSLDRKAQATIANIVCASLNFSLHHSYEILELLRCHEGCGAVDD